MLTFYEVNFFFNSRWVFVKGVFSSDYHAFIHSWCIFVLVLYLIRLLSGGLFQMVRYWFDPVWLGQYRVNPGRVTSSSQDKSEKESITTPGNPESPPTWIKKLIEKIQTPHRKLQSVVLIVRHACFGVKHHTALSGSLVWYTKQYNMNKDTLSVHWLMANVIFTLPVSFFIWFYFLLVGSFRSHHMVVALVWGTVAPGQRTMLNTNNQQLSAAASLTLGVVY